MFVCACTHACVQACVRVCVHTCVCMHACVCGSVCVHACLCVCVHIVCTEFGQRARRECVSVLGLCGLGALSIHYYYHYPGSPSLTSLTVSVDVKHQVYLLITELEDVPLVEFMYLVFTRMPGESYRRQLRSLLLYLCYVF